VEPQLVVALGATAAQALLGPSFRVTVSRGRVFPSALAPQVLATIHPSAILRERDDDARHEQLAAFIADLRVARDLIASR
jgi:uracil-DNA glycosylase family 4